MKNYNNLNRYNTDNCSSARTVRLLPSCLIHTQSCHQEEINRNKNQCNTMFYESLLSKYGTILKMTLSIHFYSSRIN